MVLNCNMSPALPSKTTCTDVLIRSVALKARPEGTISFQWHRERQTYEVPDIATSPYIRSLVEIIGHFEDIYDSETQHTAIAEEPEKGAKLNPDSPPPFMVFEWMDTDLWQLPCEPFRSNSSLPRTIARSVLEALAVFESVDGVHTDVNPNNIFISGANSSSPIVKLGDLGVGKIESA